jgi:hypothetical protein
MILKKAQVKKQKKASGSNQDEFHKQWNKINKKDIKWDKY